MTDLRNRLHPVRSQGVSDVVSLLKACAKQKDLLKGCKVHAYIRKHKFLETNAYVASTLVNMYARCGELAEAQQLLNKLSARNVVTWTALIARYVEQGQPEEALKCFDKMQEEGHSPDAVAYLCALRACGSIGAMTRGEQIHDAIASVGLLDKDIVLGTTLVGMYSLCGAVAKAQKVLNELPVRDVIMWTVLIAAYAQQGQGEEALKCFDSMQREGLSPDGVTFSCALKACGAIGAAAKGKCIHDRIVNMGLLEKDIVLGSTLVDMYAKCGALAKAQQVFDELLHRDVITWNALIGGYSQQGQGEEALECYDSMQRDGYTPDVVTFICALKACGTIGAVRKGEHIHEYIVNLGLLEKEEVLAGALIDMYVRCGELTKAQQVLDELPFENVITWNALIAGYVHQGKAEEALECLDRMKHDGQTPDAVTFVCALKACGSIGAIAKGKEIHDKVISLGFLEKDIVLGNALLDMYTRCASITRAADLFDKLPAQNLVTWNTLIGGYAQQGQIWLALKCFKRMRSKGFQPDCTTWACVLNACSHSGLVDEAEVYFLKMNTDYGIMPNGEHFCCMVDLFGRVGDIKRAFNKIEKMSSADHLPVWLALLRACRMCMDVKAGRLAFQHALHLDINDAAAYITMANINTEAGMQEDALKIHAMRVSDGAYPDLVD